MSNISFSAMDGDQLLDFYWIDPMLIAERIAAKSQYAGHHHHASLLNFSIKQVNCVGLSSSR